MSTITYTATTPTGQTATRTSGTMFYTHAIAADHDIISWHKSAANAAKAASSGLADWNRQRGATITIVEAVPTAVNGKVQRGDYSGHPNYPAVYALIAAKLGVAAAKGQ